MRRAAVRAVGHGLGSWLLHDKQERGAAVAVRLDAGHAPLVIGASGASRLQARGLAFAASLLGCEVFGGAACRLVRVELRACSARRNETPGGILPLRVCTVLPRGDPSWPYGPATATRMPSTLGCQSRR